MFPLVNENTLTSGSMFSILLLYISFGSDEENLFNNNIGNHFLMI